jgi:hypothetical protein
MSMSPGGVLRVASPRSESFKFNPSTIRRAQFAGQQLLQPQTISSADSGMGHLQLLSKLSVDAPESP